MTRIIALFSAAAVMLGIAVGVVFVLRGQAADPFGDCRRTAVAGGTAEIGGPFSLIDAEERRVTDADVITGPTLIYFGFSFCPDFCPMDLARNARVADLLAERGLEIGQVFVTVDPERDTPDMMADYTGHFHPELIGLTGTPEETAAAADAYRVYFRLGTSDDEFYMVDHSTFTYLMAPEHGFLEFFPSSAGVEEMADAVECFSRRL